MITFNKIVKKLLNNCGKIIFKEDIYKIVDPELNEKYRLSIDKIIYRLKSEKVIINLKSGVYIVPDKDDLNLNIIDLIDKYYLKLLKKYIKIYVGNNYYISGNKALGFHMKDFSIPEKIFITNKDVNKKIKLGNYEIIFKSFSLKENNKNLLKKDIFTKLQKFSEKKEIDGINFIISNLELSIVESALINDLNTGLDFNILNKAIKKYSKVLKKDTFYEIGKFKFIMSFNRLKEISKNIDNDLYLVFLDNIKKNGGLFIGEGLRRF